MKYIGEKNYQHGSKSKLGVLLVNLGTPDDTSTGSVRRYLKQFLSDPRVVEVPRLLWWLVLNGIILRFRPAKTAAAYKTVWDDQTGSPLLSIGLQQAELLQQAWPGKFQSNAVLRLAMRYGKPSIDSQLEYLRQHGVRRLLVLPLYPQYSGSTVASVFDEVAAQLSRRRWIPETRFINQYFDHPAYITALADSVHQSWEKNGRADKLVMSFHGIPERYRNNGDPYFCQCHATARLLAAQLNLDTEQFMVVFQSRFGREPWLQPYCDKTMEKLPSQGTKNIDVICPGFSADCLETIEEINEENREIFLRAGGEQFTYIEALNGRPEHIQSLLDLVENHIAGWPEARGVNTATEAELVASKQRAMALGAAQ